MHSKNTLIAMASTEKSNHGRPVGVYVGLMCHARDHASLLPRATAPNNRPKMPAGLAPSPTQCVFQLPIPLQTPPSRPPAHAPQAGRRTQPAQPRLTASDPRPSKPTPRPAPPCSSANPRLSKRLSSSSGPQPSRQTPRPRRDHPRTCARDPPPAAPAPRAPRRPATRCRRAGRSAGRRRRQHARRAANAKVRTHRSGRAAMSRVGARMGRV